MPWPGSGRRPVGHRPINQRSVFGIRQAIILVDLAAPLAIVPVPIIARVLRRPLQLLLGDVEAVPPKVGVIREVRPWDRIIVAADAQDAAEAKHGIGHLPASLVNHDALDGPHLLALGVVDSRTFHFVAADKAGSLPRFRCHGIPPSDLTVTIVSQLPRTCTACPRRPRPRRARHVRRSRYPRQGAKDMPNTRHAWYV